MSAAASSSSLPAGDGTTVATDPVTAAAPATTQPEAQPETQTEATTTTTTDTSAAADANKQAGSSSSSGPSPAGSLEIRNIAFSGDQLTYLDLVRDRFSLGSSDKVLRCLVNYCISSNDQRFIFATYRCRKCGIQFPKQTRPVGLYQHQWQFLEEMRKQYNVDDPERNGKIIRVMLDFTQVREGKQKRVGELTMDHRWSRCILKASAPLLFLRPHFLSLSRCVCVFVVCLCCVVLGGS